MRLPAPPPKFIDDPEVGDLKRLGSERPPLRRERGGLAPNRQEDFLHDLLGGRAAQRLGREREDPRRVPALERTQGLLMAGGKALHQFLVASFAKIGGGANPPNRSAPPPPRTLR